MLFPEGKTPDPLPDVLRWAENHADVRAVVLTSTRTAPDAHPDLFSDYDILLAVSEVRPFFDDRSWLYQFGPFLVVYRDPILPLYGYGKFAWITQYENGLKIDFMLFPSGLLRHIAALPELPDFLDVGYRVLLDKDGLTAGLQPPTYRAYIPSPPSEEEFFTLIEVFFHETTYAAKNLWRDQLLPMKSNLDFMKQAKLRRMLEWRMEIDHDWSLKTGAYGKGLKAHLPPEIWAELEATYTGPDPDDNWESLFRTVALFRRVGREVAAALGYEYPEDLHRRVVAYLQGVRETPRPAA